MAEKLFGENLKQNERDPYFEKMRNKYKEGSPSESEIKLKELKIENLDMSEIPKALHLTKVIDTTSVKPLKKDEVSKNEEPHQKS